MKGDHYQVLKKPLITEKTTQMLAEGNWVAFQVHSQANKIQIKEAVEKVFSVTVTKVNTLVVPGKYRRFGKTVGHTKSWKQPCCALKKAIKSNYLKGAGPDAS